MSLISDALTYVPLRQALSRKIMLRLLGWN
jgi:hypothetical protein